MPADVQEGPGDTVLTANDQNRALSDLEGLEVARQSQITGEGDDER
jgi:hypothetical protein